MTVESLREWQRKHPEKIKSAVLRRLARFRDRHRERLRKINREHKARVRLRAKITALLDNRLHRCNMRMLTTNPCKGKPRWIQGVALYCNKHKPAKGVRPWLG